MTVLTRPDQPSISYDDHGGDGPAVCLVHGITESGTSWAPIVERLGDHRVVTIDLRGHGRSGTAERYDLEASAGDVVAVLAARDLLGSSHLVGHSLGGAVVSTVGSVAPVASIVNDDQSLRLAGFASQLAEVEQPLRDPTSFAAVIDAMFDQMAGPLLGADERERIGGLRRADQDVVLGVWDLLFTMSTDEIERVVAEALGGYADRAVPYLSLFGIDPGPDYAGWLGNVSDGARVEVWPEHGHYPHLDDPDRFVDRLRSSWS
mgnify:CR=1 FL=1